MATETTKDKILTWTLTPAAWLYGAVTWVRNKLFDKEILRQEEFDIPVVAVGNLSVGGTGKTPHVEYLLDNLASDYKIAVLSRGYRRRTRGFVLANSRSNAEQLGDEPMQIYRKYGHRVVVAVCESRTEGVRELLRNYPELQLVLLDDAFQHRYVKPKVSVLLTDCSAPYTHDRLLPLGTLRESAAGAGRADIVIVTKCPEGYSKLDMRLMTNELNLMSFQDPFFSTFEYGSPKPVFPDEAIYHVSLSSLTRYDGAMLLTGIANPRPFIRHFSSYPFRRRIAHFPDHHEFTRSDIMKIIERFDAMKGERKVILTTEKDAVRLVDNPYFPLRLKPFVFYIPVMVKMLEGLNNKELIPTLRGLIDK